MLTRKRGGREGGDGRPEISVGSPLGFNQDDATIQRQRIQEHSEASAFVVREGNADASPDRLLTFGAVLLQAQGLRAHRNALRQTRSELLLSPVPRCRRGILALVVRGFRFWDNMASVSAPG